MESYPCRRVFFTRLKSRFEMGKIPHGWGRTRRKRLGDPPIYNTSLTLYTLGKRVLQKPSIFEALRFTGRKEIAMDAILAIVLLTMIRLVIPFGLVLLIGSLIERRSLRYGG